MGPLVKSHHEHQRPFEPALSMLLSGCHGAESLTFRDLQRIWGKASGLVCLASYTPRIPIQQASFALPHPRGQRNEAHRGNRVVTGHIIFLVRYL